MAHISGDTHLLLKTVGEKTQHVQGQTYRTVCEQHPGYIRWLESLPNVHGANADLQLYLWAHPPTWRWNGYTSVAPGRRTPVLAVLDTETTGLFGNDFGGMGLPMAGHVGFPKGLETKMHLLDVALQIVDPTSMAVLETQQAYVRPSQACGEVYDKDLYALACREGEPLKETLEGLMATLRHWRTRHDVYIVCHNVAFDRKVIAYHLARVGLAQEYYEWLSYPFLCTMKSTMAMDGGAYDAWARQMYPEAYTTARARFPKLERLHVMLTGNNVVQKHHALADVELVVACMPELMRRGWFAIPSSAPVPAPAQVVPAAPAAPPMKVVTAPLPNGWRRTAIRPPKTTTKTYVRSRASKTISKPSHTYNLRSRGKQSLFSP